MKRRHFLKSVSTTALGLPLVLNGLPIGILSQPLRFSSFNMESDKVLVLIQLNGGNDGLNMVVPVDRYAALSIHRPNVLLPENSVLQLTDATGLHPAMTAVKTMWDDGKIAIVQGAGYPNQNRSHFRSIDIWTSASDAEEIITTGWLGRKLEQDYPAFPENFPNENYPDPFAITIGNTVSHTCQGTAANFSMAIEDLDNLSPLAVGEDGILPDTYYGDQLAFLRTILEQTNAYSGSIETAANLGNSVANYPETRLAQGLKMVARLISGGLQTKIYVVSLGGFDTHGSQVEENDTTIGSHADLLRTLSGAIGAFQQDLEALGLEERVMGMTFSEFGRQIKSNGSFGTDHGTAAPLLLFGACVNAGILGSNPDIPNSVNVQEGVAMQHDFRDIYGTILRDWFEVDESEVRSLLYNGFQALPLVACSTTANNDIQALADRSYNFPNPFRESTTVVFNCRSERVRLSILNGEGKLIAVLTDQTLPAGEHRIAFYPGALPAGNYYYHLAKQSGSVAKAMIKI